MRARNRAFIVAIVVALVIVIAAGIAGPAAASFAAKSAVPAKALSGKVNAVYSTPGQIIKPGPGVWKVQKAFDPEQLHPIWRGGAVPKAVPLSV